MNGTQPRVRNTYLFRLNGLLHERSELPIRRFLPNRGCIHSQAGVVRPATPLAGSGLLYLSFECVH